MIDNKTEVAKKNPPKDFTNQKIVRNKHYKQNKYIN